MFEGPIKDAKPENPVTDPGQPAAAAAKAEKVRSSRYEWEAKSAETDAPSKSKSNAARSSFLAACAAWFKKFFAGRDFFDKDDDATPSAA